ncbi:unnamed protein product [Dibothriocephalus latus]|uniref:Uncharacterized protein n=1 Tax=Dibothriocephalus latus TaxID=60516 RepID=A0A3P7P464_DIBLA|nr:unnamed protein product [Dibothriocephalus latus]
MNSSTASFSPKDDALFSTLLPVLIQCFGVILLGYFAGKFKVLTEAQVKGLGTYVTKFALPSIFFSVSRFLPFLHLAEKLWVLFLTCTVRKTLLCIVVSMINMNLKSTLNKQLFSICLIITPL